MNQPPVNPPQANRPHAKRSANKRSGNKRSGNKRRAKKREGFFLILVLVVIVVATMAVYSFTDLMIAYDESAYVAGDLVQARMSVESGAEVLRLLLSQTPEQRYESGGVYNNPNLFQAVTISQGVDTQTFSNFSVPAPALNDTGTFGGLRFGLQNESARLNINAMTTVDVNSDAMIAILQASANADEVPDNMAVSMLMGLPSMTEDVAIAILDWLDEDDDIRDPNGAELEYYESLGTQYTPTNGPLTSVEELLLVRGVTPQLLFGADANRNGLIDPDEQQRYNVTSDTPGALGWAQYITIHGAEASKTYTGELRVNVNKDDLEQMYDELLTLLGDETMASYITAFRIAGQPAANALAAGAEQQQAEQPEQTQTDGPWTSDLLDQLDLSGGGGTDLTQVLDLIGSTVSVGEGDSARTYESPFVNDPIAMAVYLPIIMDALTTSDAEVLPGRININECPSELLYGIPLLTAEQVEQILELREVSSDDPNRRHETWLMVEGIVTLDEMRTLIPLVTCGGDVYRAQIVGYLEKGGAAHRSEVVIDATTVNPKVVAWRNMTHLGRGFDLSVLGLRSGIESLP